MYYSGGAWLVYPGGVVSNVDRYVYNSYGWLILPSTVTNLDAFITTTTGDISHADNISIYTYSYGKLFKYL